jgi:hypothetical protein
MDEKLLYKLSKLQNFKNIKEKCISRCIDPTQKIINEYNRLNRIKNTNIYFIQSIYGGPIKIGKAYNMSKRFKQIQANCPYKLKIILLFENEHEKLEKFLHKNFSKHRLHGEWFNSKIVYELEDVLNEYENK